MKIRTHFKLAFAIVLLALAHLQMKQGGATTFLNPEVVAAVVLVIMGSVFVGKEEPQRGADDIKSPFLESSDDYDLTA